MRKMAKHIIYYLLVLFSLSSLIGQNSQLQQDKITYQCPPCGCPHDGQHFEAMGTCPSCNMNLRPHYPNIERQPSNPRVTVGILLFNGADIMDVTGPWSVFEHAGMDVVTMAKTTDMVQVGMTMNVNPDFAINTLPQIDVIVVPGGGLAEMGGDEEIVQWLKERATSTKTIFSVCSGAFILGEAGLLDGKEATTFASLIPALKEQFPKANVLHSIQYTDNGKVVTSAGLSSGIDAAFHVVSKYYGQGRAQDIANHMEYDWSPNNDYARTLLADNFIIDIRSLVSLFSTKYIYSNGDKNNWEYNFLLSDKISPEKVISLLGNELDKNSSWKKTGISSNTLNGVVSNEKLGKAKIKIAIKKHTEGNMVIVSAKRK